MRYGSFALELIEILVKTQSSVILGLGINSINFSTLGCHNF